MTVRYRGPAASPAAYLTLGIVADVEPDYDVSVSRLDFPAGQKSSRVVALTRRLADHLKVSQATCNHPAFEARVVEPEAGGSRWEVEVTLDPERLRASPMNGSEQLMISTDNEHEPIHRVPLFAKK